ncbi:transposase, partial [Candidatus Poribacteria bacterium]
MSYESTIKRLPNFLRYVNKVYRFSQTIDSMQGNSNAEVSPQTIYMSVFLCMLLRLGSLRQLSRDVADGKIRKFLPKVDKETYCANTVGNGLEDIDIKTLQHELSVVPKKLRRNKAYGNAEHPRTIGGFRIVAVDGTEYFRSESIHCPDCMVVHVKVKDGIKINYVHRIVIMYVVGRLHLSGRRLRGNKTSSVQVILGAEPALPKDIVQGEEAGHEGEGTAAKRLIQKMIALYGNGFFDILTTDAYYANKPFVLFLDSLDKYLVSRVKDARTTLYKEIETLSQMVEPIHVDDRENRVESWIYEVPELHAVLDWDVPTRGFKITEKAYKIVSGEKIYIKEETFLCMSTLPVEMADANIVREIVHAKWGVENNAIKDLKDNWHMEHNFHHHPNATYALLLILFMAHN